jgi:extracellular elastinolytic metalloproteinase
VAVALVLVPALASHAEPAKVGSTNLDRRRPIAASPGAVSSATRAAVARWTERPGDLRVRRDPRTGGARALVGAAGYLTKEAPRALADHELEPYVLQFVRSELDLFGLDDSALDTLEPTRRVIRAGDDLVHLRFTQELHGLPVYGAELRVSLLRDGRILAVHHELATRPPTAPARPGIDLDAATRAAIAEVAAHGYTASSISNSRLVLLPLPDGRLRLAWNFQLEATDGRHLWDLTVDAEDGVVWTRFDWVAEGGMQYEVYPLPVESPRHTSPAPPADARSVELEPAFPGASPFGWHDTNGVAGSEYTVTRGNNVYACLDVNDNDLCDGGSAPDGGEALVFRFPIALDQPPTAYADATVVNLFYWTNILHDLFHHYGFDPSSGNFQHNNYGLGGVANDALRADLQNGGCANNAFFTTPADGTPPRMELCLGTTPSPDVDGGLDNGVVIHEYGHGVSRRLVGVSCLGNEEQMGEGWSDFFALALTARPGDLPHEPRGFATYLLGQPPDGPGARIRPYSTSWALNELTYADLPEASIPNGVGTIWATMLWDVYWALIAEHGYSNDLFGEPASAGNRLALRLVVDGLQIAPCSPGFESARDAILAADFARTGGQNRCTLWEAFARRGLGQGADQGSTDDLGDGLAAFDLPSDCPAIFRDDFEAATTGRWSDAAP